ncbi:hypothetical protein C8R48DRAFT_562774, partial [Suillus tomentosus]
FVAAHGKRKTFHVGSNSSCHQHIHSHYEVYQKKCAEMGLCEHHYAVPRSLVQEREQVKTSGQKRLT